jgi:hypothetical protein
MARRSVPPPKPKSPTLTVGQKRRRVERLQKCVTSLEAFDPQKARKHAPMVLALEAAIDQALSSPNFNLVNSFVEVSNSSILGLSLRRFARPRLGQRRRILDISHLKWPTGVWLICE